jgi:hypothetical protein
MNPENAGKTNPSPAVIGNTTARELTSSTSPSFSFPVGYYDLHPDININFQLNRFYDWVGDESMLTEMREAVAGVNDYPTFTKVILDLGEKALARHCQVGNYGLAFGTIIVWMTGLGPTGVTTAELA